MLSFLDTNHNAKNCRSHLVGGAAPASIGKFTVDPWLYRMAADKYGLTKETIRVSDFASDGVVLGLASAKIVQAVLNLDSNDQGNTLVSLLPLVKMNHL